MATYKLIQDIEAEDHILGPLTLRQFIYALVAAFCLYMCFIGLTKHVWPLLAIFLPIALLAGFFAFPFGKDQPTEVWALAKIRFLFMPRRRIWDQSGIKELVTITVPKKIEKVYTDGLSQTEVRSRLSALASTIDSRGWAIKNVNVSMYGQPALVGTSDRLIDPSNIPQAVPDYDITASDDMLDEQNNPVAQQFSQMIGASSQAHRQQLVNQLNDTSTPPAAQSGTPADYWFLNQTAAPGAVPPGNAVFDSQVVLPGTDASNGPKAGEATPEEEALVAEHAKQQEHSQAVSYNHLRTVQPLSAQPQAPSPAPAVQAPVNDSQTAQADTGSATPDPAILELAGNNDLDVATLARQAKKAKGSDDDEVVISLH